MIGIGYVQRMARYNRWQNESLYVVADRLSDEERKRDRGAFFGSIHATLNHLLWADRMWMSRFAGTPKPAGGIPESVSLHESWHEQKRERAAFDAVIVDWADQLDPAWLDGDVLIVPVIEEMLVVEKRLVLKEELHIRKQRRTEQIEEPITVRSMRAVVEREPLDGDKSE